MISILRQADRIRDARIGWEEGAERGIPLCCRARWSAGVLRPPLLSRWAPGLSARLRRALRPRYAVADGIVPCEAHLLRYLLTGKRPLPPEVRNRSGTCCEYRQSMAQHAGVVIRHTVIPPEELIPGGGEAWMLVIDGEEHVSLHFCPWCGAPLPMAIQGHRGGDEPPHAH